MRWSRFGGLVGGFHEYRFDCFDGGFVDCGCDFDGIGGIGRKYSFHGTVVIETKKRLGSGVGRFAWFLKIFLGKFLIVLFEILLNKIGKTITTLM